MDKNAASKFFLSAILVAFLALGLLFPAATLFLRAFQDGAGNWIGFRNFARYFTSPATAASLKNSLAVSLTVTTVTVGLAFLYAFGIERTHIRGKTILRGIASAPLFVPSMTHGIALIYLLGRQGLLTRLFGFGFPIYGFWGIVLAETVYVFPVVFFMLALAFHAEDFRTYEMAEIMGVGILKRFFSITVPNVKYTVITCCFSAFTLCFTDFGAPKVVGGNYNVMATDIYKQVIGQQNFPMGATVGALLISLTLLAFFAELLLRNKSAKIDAMATRYIIRKNPWRDGFYTLFNWGFAAAILVFGGTIVFASLIRNWPYDFTLSFRSWQFTVMGESVWSILAYSVALAGITALLGTTLCFFTAYAVQRERNFFWLRKTGYFLSVLPNAIPGMTIGLAYIAFFNAKSGLRSFLYGTSGILVLANIIHFFASPFLAMTAKLKRIDQEYEYISEIMGVPWYLTVARVILPLSLDTILESVAYFFTNAMTTVSAAIFLYTARTRVISVMMVSKSDSGDVEYAVAISVMIMLVNILFKCGFTYLGRFVRRK
ncbi:MAG: ABC transporter permease subunit [Fusobacteriaceae bacterium]|jgi:iron(III) transport system permease protein|nr:ABC transporter permease subunit [Fusobacteriaceae bacterium]